MVVFVDAQRGAELRRAHPLVLRLREEPFFCESQPSHQFDVDSPVERTSKERGVDEQAVPGLGRNVGAEVCERGAITRVEILNAPKRRRSALDVEPHVGRVHGIECGAAMTDEPESVEHPFSGHAGGFRAHRRVDLLLELVRHHGEQGMRVARKRSQLRAVLHRLLDSRPTDVSTEAVQQRRDGDAGLGWMLRGVPGDGRSSACNVEQRFQPIANGRSERLSVRRRRQSCRPVRDRPLRSLRWGPRHPWRALPRLRSLPRLPG